MPSCLRCRPEESAACLETLESDGTGTAIAKFPLETREAEIRLSLPLEALDAAGEPADLPKGCLGGGKPPGYSELLHIGQRAAPRPPELQPASRLVKKARNPSLGGFPGLFQSAKEASAGSSFYFGKMTLTEGNLSRLPGGPSCGMLSLTAGCSRRENSPEEENH